ncbi:MAG TPA: hypothetical protein VGO52_15570 [Hyphomonadaceae bacterium]|nr:hypothetical protein [Hyphomonadaceae bacterium]
MLLHAKLKAKQRKLRATFPQAFDHRIHRALSWLGRSEREANDKDIQFVLLWIAFNAAYADDRDITSGTERTCFKRFLEKLVELDREGRINQAVWDLYHEEIEHLLRNKYVFQPFWANFNGTPGYADWEVRFEKSLHQSSGALKRRETAKVLQILFDRLYVLRNQMMHGGATWNGSVNREQVNFGAEVLAYILPVVFDVMLNNPKEDWGRLLYPVHRSIAQKAPVAAG